MSDKPKAKEVLASVEDLATDMVAIIQGLDKSNVPMLLKAFKELNEIKGVIDRIQKTVEQTYQTLSYVTIPDAFETQGFDSVKAHARNFVVSVRINASIPEDMRPSGHKWITETLGVPELIRETVNPKQLSSAIRDYFETHAQWPPEDAIKVHKQRFTSIRKT